MDARPDGCGADLQGVHAELDLMHGGRANRHMPFVAWAVGSLCWLLAVVAAGITFLAVSSPVGFFAVLLGIGFGVPALFGQWLARTTRTEVRIDPWHFRVGPHTFLRERLRDVSLRRQRLRGGHVAVQLQVVRDDETFVWDVAEAQADRVTWVLAQRAHVPIRRVGDPSDVPPSLQVLQDTERT